MALPALELLEAVELDPHRRGHRARVDEGEPAERDDAEEELGRVAGLAVVEAELGADRRERFLARREVPDALELGGAAQRFALDEADEVRTGGQEVEVVGYGAGEDDVGALAAG